MIASPIRDAGKVFVFKTALFESFPQARGKRMAVNHLSLLGHIASHSQFRVAHFWCVFILPGEVRKSSSRHPPNVFLLAVDFKYASNNLR